MAVEEENPYHYTGLHAFGFLERPGQPPDAVIAAIDELGKPPGGPVIWAGSFVGDYAGLVHVRVEDGALGTLQDRSPGSCTAAGSVGDGRSRRGRSSRAAAPRRSSA